MNPRNPNVLEGHDGVILRCPHDLIGYGGLRSEDEYVFCELIPKAVPFFHWYQTIGTHVSGSTVARINAHLSLSDRAQLDCEKSEMIR